MVTSLVIDDVLRVPREDRRRFRAMLHQCQREGVETAARGRAGFAAYLRGIASYLNMVHPDEGPELLKQVDAVLDAETEPEEGEDA